MVCNSDAQFSPKINVLIEEQSKRCTRVVLLRRRGADTVIRVKFFNFILNFHLDNIQIYRIICKKENYKTLLKNNLKSKINA